MIRSLRFVMPMILAIVLHSANLCANDTVGTDRESTAASQEGLTAKQKKLGRLFDRLDRNNDGKLTANEVRANRRQIFRQALRKADTNRDGALSRKEFIEGWSGRKVANPRRGPPTHGLFRIRDPKKFIELHDKNGDGKVTIDEFPERRHGYFKRLIERADINGDDAVTAEEIELLNSDASRPGRRDRDGVNARVLFLFMDRNGDGRLSKEELIELAEELANIDKDGVSFNELMAAAKRRRQVQRTLRGLDKNGNSQISRDEAKGQVAEHFGELDSNADGQLDKEELDKGLPGLREAQNHKDRDVKDRRADDKKEKEAAEEEL